MPNELLVTFVFGEPKSGVLKVLKVSKRSWNRTLSVMLKFLLSDMSKIGAQGSRRLARRSGMSASVLSVLRRTHAGSVHGWKAVLVVPATRTPWRAVPSACNTQLLKKRSKLDSPPRVGSLIR